MQDMQADKPLKKPLVDTRSHAVIPFIAIRYLFSLLYYHRLWGVNRISKVLQQEAVTAQPPLCAPASFAAISILFCYKS
jgi:hypothetical protein